MKITATIKGVNEAPREYTNDKGTTFYVNGDFQEGQFSVGVRDLGKAESLIAELKKLQGTPHEYEVEERGERNGRPQYYLKGWPGKPAFTPGGRPGGGNFTPRYRDTEQGTKEERDAIARSVALQQAVIHLSGKENTKKDAIDVLTIADDFYGWLVGPQRATPASPAQIQAQSKQASSLVQRANELFNGPEEGNSEPPARHAGGYQVRNCPNCGKPDAVRKSKLDGTPPWYCFAKIGGCGHQWGDYSPQLSADPEPRSPASLASEEIAKCVKNKDASHLRAVVSRIADRVVQGVISQAEADDLDIESSTAKHAIEHNLSQDEWHKNLREAMQNRHEPEELHGLRDRF